LVVSPRQAWQGERLQTGARLWGLSAQLYSLRSQHNWGIGDFADLRLLVEGAAAAGAHFILLNPLHALDLRYPENASPYSPDDRRFLNPLYLALPDCEDFHAEPVQRLVQEAAFAAELARLRATEQVAYSGVQALKLRVLEPMYRVLA